MSIYSYKNIHAKVQEFATGGQHGKGIVFLRKILKNKEYFGNESLRLDLAFLLYHQALKFYWKQGMSDTLKKKIERQLEESIKICKLIVNSKKSDSGSKNVTNANIFLAQIYACMNNPEGITLAKQNFRKEKNALTANRLADVYMRLHKEKNAEIWYKKYEKLALKEKIPQFLVSADLAIFYKRIGKEKLAKNYLGKALFNLPKTKQGLSMFSILKQYFDLNK